MATLLSKAEKSYIVSSLTSTSPPLRHDGRGPQDYRLISLLTGDEVAPLANGSAKARVGGTEVVAAVRLEVEDLLVVESEGGGGGRIRCNVTCSPAAYPHLSTNQQDDLQSDLTSFLQSAFTPPTTSSSPSPTSFAHLLTQDLTILPGRKAWALYLDAVVLSDAGNLYDVLFIACRGALWDTRIPRTRAVEYQATTQPTKNTKGTGGGGNGDEEMEDMWKSAVQTKKARRAADFELEDNWDYGYPLSARASCPVAVTLNVLPTTHIVDATQSEEQAVPLKLVVLYSVTKGSLPSFMGMRLLGPGHVPTEYLKGLLHDAQQYATLLVQSLDAQLIARTT
ncbi:ribosomal protein S5 domain 2-like protein [Serendipita vermifera]|nr:ribosomal protein S5 domain 2-like protein [Serendipita vermifera]